MGLGDPWTTRPKVVIPVEAKSRRPFLERSPSSSDGLLVAAIILSIALHAMLAGTLVLANVLDKLWGPSKAAPEPVMEILDLAEFPALERQVREMAKIPGVNAPAIEAPPPPDAKGQIVDLAKPAQPETAPADAKYLAEHDRSAKEETVARELALTPGITADEFKGLGDAPNQGTDRFAGDTTNDRDVIGPAKGEEGESGELAKPDEGKSIREVLERDPFGILVKKPEADESPRSAGLPGRPGGAIAQQGTGVEVAMAGAPNNDYLPNVRKGDKTQLNAKEFVFASFWNRMQRQVEPFWVKHVRSANPGQIQKRDYTTRANLTLAADGSLVAVEIVQSCGVPAWDRAVIQAFTEAAPFLNPPERLVDPDGKIRLGDLGFTVSLTGGKVVHMYGDPRAGKLFPGISEGGIGPR